MQRSAIQQLRFPQDYEADAYAERDNTEDNEQAIFQHRLRKYLFGASRLIADTFHFREICIQAHRQVAAFVVRPVTVLTPGLHPIQRFLVSFEAAREDQRSISDYID